jgi:hypothetical protein
MMAGDTNLLNEITIIEELEQKAAPTALGDTT